jgi:phage-related protein
VYVLYTHKKKSRRGRSIPKREEDLIVRRFKDAMSECRERGIES